MDSNKLTLKDFGEGLLAALRIKGLEDLDMNRLTDVHAAFFDAFEIVKEQLGQTHLEFAIVILSTTNKSIDVHQILAFWLGTWTQRDSPDSTLRVMMSERAAENILHQIPGVRDVFLHAADAFLVRYNKTG